MGLAKLVARLLAEQVLQSAEAFTGRYQAQTPKESHATSTEIPKCQAQSRTPFQMLINDICCWKDVTSSALIKARAVLNFESI